MKLTALQARMTSIFKKFKKRIKFPIQYQLLIILLTITLSGFCQTQFWGVAAGGGTRSTGGIYIINSDGTGSQMVYNNTLSNMPTGGLLYATDKKFYGLSYKFSDYTGFLFSYNPITNSYSNVVSFGGSNESTFGGMPYLTNLIQASDGMIYGLTYYGGINDAGVVFKYDPIKSEYVKIHDFDGTKGSNPEGSLIEYDGKLYGTTLYGGSLGGGILYQIDLKSFAFQVLFNFGYNSKSLYQPDSPTSGRLCKSRDGKIYGMTSKGGNYGNGTIYQFSPASNAVQVIYSFSPSSSPSSSGAVRPIASLVEGLNGVMYGKTFGGGKGYGTIFKMDMSSNSFTKIFDLSSNGYSLDLSGDFILQDGNLYGTSISASGYWLFKIDVSNDILTPLYTYDSNSSSPIFAPIGNLAVIPRLSQSINFSSIPPVSYSNQSFQLTATSSSGLPITYTSSNQNVATISGSTITIVGAGSTVITASQAGNASYNPAVNVQQTFTVNKADQTISFGTLPVKKNTDTAFAILATASSGLPVSFASSNTSVATVSGNTITIVGVGTTNITASQAGNANYNVATNAVQVLSVVSAVNPILSIMQGITTIASNGTYNFGNVNMLSNSGYVVFTVYNLGNAVLNLDIANSTLTGANAADFSVDLSALSQPVTTNSFQSKIKFTPTGAGVRTAKISILSNDPVNNPYIINLTGTGVKLNQSITFGALASRNVTDAAFALTATATSQLPVSYASSNTAVATISGSTVTIVGAGTTTITASQTGNDNYNAATSVTQTLTVTAKQSQTITFAALPTKTFGDAAFTLGATASSQLAVSYASSNTEVAIISGNTVTIVGAGTSTITASQAGNDAFAAAASVSQTLTVSKANQAITFAALPAKILGSAAFSIIASGGASGLPVTFASSNTSVATISGSTVTVVAAGTTNITASQSGNANYNPAADVVQPLIVTAKQNQTITFAALADKTLGETAFALTATASSGLEVAYSTTSDKITISGSQVTLVKAGRASIVANQAGNDAFNAATAVTQSFCIKPVKPIITLSNNNTETVTLTSSATTGNQWYLAGAAISGATNATLAVTALGIYKVQVKVDDCASEFSADQTILVTGDIKSDGSTISVSPNPVDELLQLNGIVGEIKSNHLFDVTGRTAAPLTLEKKNELYQASVEHLNQGVYVLRILQENKVVQLKFVKK